MNKYDDFEDTSTQEQWFLEKFRARERREMRDFHPAITRPRESKMRNRETRSSNSVPEFQS